jgi:hypothetical protein
MHYPGFELICLVTKTLFLQTLSLSLLSVVFTESQQRRQAVSLPSDQHPLPAGPC